MAHRKGLFRNPAHLTLSRIRHQPHFITLALFVLFGVIILVHLSNRGNSGLQL
ncbi:hypothetical protein [Puia dinghuensis]|uniref:Uncharacterized protein n=1 Tax=Puia dinghuensis TaxID=1792502 RepID=A0A8J2XUJ2_9BACT|nr:hypothetical protein [Puia dinghuensis]GGB07767.1 hypothetical protein GCM10011511_34120 [Puia dinghuensis]